jgi:hypothetical protein
VFETSPGGPAKPDASDRVSTVEPKTEQTRTPRTGGTDSDQHLIDFSRTTRTPQPLVTRGANEGGKPEGQLMEYAAGVRSVRENEPTVPHLLADGTLVIPFGSPRRFHWWDGGQSISETRAEILTETDQKERHVSGI